MSFDQDLASAKYMQPEDLEALETRPRRQQGQPVKGENLNKIVGLTLCPIALVIGVGWFLQSADNYVENKKNEMRSNINAISARAQKQTIQDIKDMQWNAAESHRKFAEIGRQLNNR